MRTLVIAFAVAMLVVLSSTTVIASRVRATSPADAAPTLEASAEIQPSILVFHSGQAINPQGVVSWSLDPSNKSLVVTLAASAPSPISILINRAWLLGSIPHPAFGNTSFTVVSYATLSWYNLTLSSPASPQRLEVRDFHPEQARAWYTLGSPDSIALQRPMRVQIVEVPRTETRTVNSTGANGTWSELRQFSVNRLGISFQDTDTSGQAITLNKTWLASYGITNANFCFADGKPIANESDAFSFYLNPPHFSILFAFTSGDGFAQESSQSYSDVHWDSSNLNVYLLSDRQDPANTNEMLRNNAVGTYDDTSSFTVRATWQTSQQGNWQMAVPLFLMHSANSRVDMANSIYVLYQSRDSNLHYNPYYLLRMRDSAGALQCNRQITDALTNAQYEFEFSYSGYSHYLTISMYSADDVTSWTTQCYFGPSVHFTLGKIGAAAWGSGTSAEPVTIAKADSIYLDGDRARNSNFEVDSNSDGIPDYWQGWIWTKGPVYRSTDRAKSGSWSVKIADSNSGLDYGLQTDRIAVGAGAGFVGSSWVYAVSGTFAICMEAWDSQTSGMRLGVTCTNTATTGTWEYLETYIAGPSSGTNYIDLLLYSTSGNTGTGYFDGGEIHPRRSFWAVNVHNGEPATGGTWSGWQTAIDKVADLGASYIRSDFPWSTFEPNADGVWDDTYVAHWTQVLNIAKTRGVGFIMNLKGPTPGWAAGLTDVTAKFGEFCRGIGQRFSGMVPYFQILNEANWNNDVVPVGSLSGAINSCYSGLLQGMGIASTSHKAYFHTIVNVFITVGWESALEQMLAGASSSIDIVAIDFYPLTDNINNACSDWGVLNGLFSIMDEYGKAGAIMETGFANRDLLLNWRDDSLQLAWIECALPVVQAYVIGRNTQSQSRPMLLANWYELYDHLTGSWNPWDTYGIIHSDLTEKLGYFDLRYRIPSWPW